MFRFAALLAGILLVVAACGDSGGGFSEGEQALSDAIRDSILEDAEPDDPFGEAEATCIGDSAVTEFGTDGLLELGITVENADPGDSFEGATDAQIDTVIDLTLDCVDFTQAFVDAAAGDISQDSANCLGEGIEREGLLRPLVRGSFEGDEFDLADDPEIAQTFFQLFVDCLSAEELANLGN